MCIVDRVLDVCSERPDIITWPCSPSVLSRGRNMRNFPSIFEIFNFLHSLVVSMYFVVFPPPEPVLSMKSRPMRHPMHWYLSLSAQNTVGLEVVNSRVFRLRHLAQNASRGRNEAKIRLAGNQHSAQVLGVELHTNEPGVVL
jgi:hypothetical protein